MQQTLQKGSQSKGGMSEDLAKLAREQAQIRKMLQDMMDNQKGTEIGKKLGDEVKDLLKKMEETETDLVNKRLNPDLIKRQQELLTRLLESEKALKEQEEDQKRKAETAKNYERKVPPQFQQYVKDKQKQTELLKTVPPNLNPYYKQQVDYYFKRFNKKGQRLLAFFILQTLFRLFDLQLVHFHFPFSLAVLYLHILWC
jgi:hypothetical protein